MKRWLKLDADYPFGHTAKKIRERFGHDGLLVWILLLAAAKRNVPEGELSHTSEQHFWILLGLTGDEFEFDSETFLTYTGQLKQTRKTRSGDVKKTEITHWGEWQEAWRKDDARERMSRKRRESHANTLRTESEHAANRNVTEREIEREIENKPPLTPPGGNGVVKEIYEHWRTSRHKTDVRYEKLSEGRKRKIIARLREFTPAQLIRAIDMVALDPWEDRPRHDDLTVIFRSQEQVDKFLALGDQSRNGKPSAEEKVARTIARQQ